MYKESLRLFILKQLSQNLFNLRGNNLQETILIFRSVSWIRGSDSHIITVDQETFISDDRFSSLVKTSDNLWTLKVSGDRLGECQ